MDQGPTGLMPAVLWLAGLLIVAAGLVLGRVHRRLRRSEQRLRDLFDHAADGIFVADTTGRYVEVNDAGCQMLGLRRDEIIGRTIADFIPPQDLPRLAQAREWLLAGHSQVAEWTLRCKNGDWLPVEISTRIMPSGQWQAFVRDMRERHQAQAQLQLAATVFSSTQEGIIVTDAHRRIVAVNPAFSAISGYAPEELLGRDPSLQQSGRHDHAFYDGVWDALNRTDQWRGEIWNRRKNGEIYPAWENISRIRDANGEVTHYVAIQSDITPIKDAEARLRHLAHHDLLTGLPNRLLFANALQLSMARAARHRQRLALMFIDLDRFKFVNDSLGHAAGDQLLIAIGQRLKAAVRAEDAVARLGGDEFTVVVEEAGSVDSMAALARKIIQAVSAPLVLSGRKIAISASIGIALFPEDADTVDNLCRAADAAMYRAKERGRGVCDFYTPDITERVHEHLMLDGALHQALQRQELRLLF
ncbi:MAG: diguanylate cyclase, partial [Burkholderiaceae bacterium]